MEKEVNQQTGEEIRKNIETANRRDNARYAQAQRDEVARREKQTGGGDAPPVSPAHQRAAAARAKRRQWNYPPAPKRVSPVEAAAARGEGNAPRKIVYRPSLGIWVYSGTDINALLYNPDGSPKWENPTTVMQKGDSYGIKAPRTGDFVTIKGKQYQVSRGVGARFIQEGFDFYAQPVNAKTGVGWQAERFFKLSDIQQATTNQN
jgi:hypothetical protein